MSMTIEELRAAVRELESDCTTYIAERIAQFTALTGQRPDAVHVRMAQFQHYEDRNPSSIVSDVEVDLKLR